MYDREHTCENRTYRSRTTFHTLDPTDPINKRAVLFLERQGGRPRGLRPPTTAGALPTPAGPPSLVRFRDGGSRPVCAEFEVGILHGLGVVRNFYVFFFKSMIFVEKFDLYLLFSYCILVILCETYRSWWFDIILFMFHMWNVHF